MIDTDKYEGHLNVYGFTFCSNTYQIMKEEGDDIERLNPTTALLTDAPLILQALIDERAEVKRLHEAIVDMIDSMDNWYIRDVQHAAGCLRDLIGYYDEEE